MLDYLPDEPSSGPVRMINVFPLKELNQIPFDFFQVIVVAKPAKKL